MFILPYIQIGSAIVLIVTVMLQQRGNGLSGGIMGGSLEFSTRRGIEKGVFWTTIIAGVVFVVASIVRLVVAA